MPGDWRKEIEHGTQSHQGNRLRGQHRHNVYADLAFPDAAEMLAKARIVAQIARIIQARKLTQAQAGELLGIDQPKVSALLRGQFKGYSQERLIGFLTRLGVGRLRLTNTREIGTMSEEGDGKHGVQSLEVGMGILRAMVRGQRSMMLKDIVAALKRAAANLSERLGHTETQAGA